MMHIHARELTILGSGNGLSPVQWQAITGTKVDFLSIGQTSTNFGKILIKMQWFSFKKMQLKMVYVNFLVCFVPSGL